MPDVQEVAVAVAETLAANPDQKWIEVDTRGMSARDILALIDAVYDACTVASIALKGVKVDPTQLAIPADAEYINAFMRQGRVIVVDLAIDDMLVFGRK